eukprot:COSAG02_NODE_828_length_16703_cov_298.705312_5_plen_377_part_00
MSQDDFFNLHLTEQQKTQLLIGVNQVCACLQSNHDSVRQSLLQTIEDELYYQSISARSENNLLTDQHPVLRTTADPHACKPVSKDKESNRRSVMRSVYRTVTGIDPLSNPPTREECNELIQKTDECVEALKAIYKTQKSWTTMATIYWLQAVKVHGFPELAHEYYEKLSKIESPPPTKKETISKEDTAKIREINIQLATEALKHRDPVQARDAILCLLIWGCNQDHCPARRGDAPKLTWGHVSIDQDKTAWLQFENSAKVKVTDMIPLDEQNQLLNELLCTLKPVAADDMFLIHERQIARNTVNGMLERIYKGNGLDDRLAKFASSTNRSRDRSAADDPNRPSLKDQERQRKRARHRLHSVTTAQTMYAQDTLSDV